MIAFLWLQLGLAMVAVSGEPNRAEPTEPPVSWFSDGDYPVGALRRGAEGQVRIRLHVDATGRPLRCEVEESSSDEELDAATCEVALSRVRFRPARDANGNAVADTFSTRIDWRIQDDEGPGMDFAAHEVFSTLSVSATGELTCVIAVNGAAGRRARVEGCGFLPALRADEALRQVGAEAEVAMAFWVVPEGEARPAAPVGENLAPLARIEAEFSLAPDGSFVDCRIVVRQLPDTAGPAAGLPDPCRMHSPGRNGLFAPAADGVGPRRGRMGFDLYGRFGRPL